MTDDERLQLLFERDSAREQAATYKRLAEEGASFRARYEASQEALTETLAGSLELATKLDGAYLERNQLVAALSKLFPAGVKRTAIEGWDPEWHGCVYVDLPTGQTSWHFHDREAALFAHLGEYVGEWDGHSTEEKYRRVAALVAQGWRAEHPTEPGYYWLWNSREIQVVRVDALRRVWFTGNELEDWIPGYEAHGVNDLRWLGPIAPPAPPEVAP